VDLEPKLMGDSLGAVGWPIEAVLENPFLDFWRDAVGVRASRTSAFLDQGSDAADLEGPSDLIEGVAVIAHDAAGLRDVAELLGKLEQGELPLGTLGWGPTRALAASTVGELLN